MPSGSERNISAGRGLAGRRASFALLALAVLAGLLALAWRVLAPGGWTAWEGLILLAYAATAPWTALCAANGLTGFLVRALAHDPLAVAVPAPVPAPASASASVPRPRVAIAVCLRHEAVEAVLPPLAALLAGLDAAGQGGRHVLRLLSDSTEPAAVAAEDAAVAALAARHPPGRVALRRRAGRTGFKAGNLMDFLDHGADGFGYVLVLDADSAMTAPAVLRLVAAMDADPGLAILQALIAGRPAAAAFPRLFQFGMRAGMRSWATGQAWWQGPEGPYWGHNALLRIAPFRAHARLAPLAGGQAILSHDQVEAVRLHAAGWAVRVLPDDTGSLEGNPPALPEFLARDARWAAGNLQYPALLRDPALTPMGRWQLVQAILLFAAAPFWAALLPLAALNVATGGGADTPRGALALLMAATWAALHAPKLLGYAEILRAAPLAARYGGRKVFLRGALAELAFTSLLDPVSLAAKAGTLLALPFGGAGGWAAQNRAARGVAWADAARLLWPHTLFGAACCALLAVGGWGPVLWALPPAGGLLVAVPLCVLTASPRLSGWLRARRVAATPEELAGMAP